MLLQPSDMHLTEYKDYAQIILHLSFYLFGFVGSRTPLLRFIRLSLWLRYPIFEQVAWTHPIKGYHYAIFRFTEVIKYISYIYRLLTTPHITIFVLFAREMAKLIRSYSKYPYVDILAHTLI